MERTSRLLLPALLLATLAGCGDDSSMPVDGGATDGAGALCGNGMVEGDEECDFGDGNSDTIVDRCRLDCTNASCGDGVVDTNDECDDGEGNDDTLVDACRTTCEAAHCGDGVVDAGESCDDGNLDAGDGCDPMCRFDQSCLLALSAEGTEMRMEGFRIDGDTMGLVSTGVTAGVEDDPAAISEVLAWRAITLCGRHAFALTESSILQSELDALGSPGPVTRIPFSRGLGLECDPEGERLYTLSNEAAGPSAGVFLVSPEGELGAHNTVAIPLGMEGGIYEIIPQEGGEAWVFGVGYEGGRPTSAYAHPLVVSMAGEPSLGERKPMETGFVLGGDMNATLSVLSTFTPTGMGTNNMTCLASFVEAPTAPGSLPGSTQCLESAMLLFGVDIAPSGDVVYASTGEVLVAAPLATDGTLSELVEFPFPSAGNPTGGALVSQDGAFVVAHNTLAIHLFQVGAGPTDLLKTDDVAGGFVDVLITRCARR